MADIYLTVDQLNSLFWDLTAQILDLDPEDPETSLAIRISWPINGAPALNITDNVTFIKVLFPDDDYNRIRDVVYTDAEDDDNINQVTGYTRVVQVIWTCYGPTAEDRVQRIRDYLFYDDIHDSLAPYDLFLITDIEEPRRVPEFFETRWWERVDMHAEFNERIIRNRVIPAIRRVPVIIDTGTTDPYPTTRPTDPATPIPGEPTTIENVNLTIVKG